MPIQSTDTETTITFADDEVTWTVKAGVAVSTTYEAVVMDYDGDVLMNHGDLVAGEGRACVSIGGGYATVLNAVDGYIEGFYGVSAAGVETNIFNDGVIYASSLGVGLGGAYSNLDNHGRIFSADYGVSGSTGAIYAHVVNSGTIEARGTAIRLDATNVVVSNSGTISGGDYAVTMGGGRLINSGELDGIVQGGVASLSIDNSGSIHGLVRLGLLGDLYDGRSGSVSGLVTGYDGADTLLGGAGDDQFSGDMGADRMDGGKGGGEDVFVYTDIKESRPSAHDLIARHWGSTDLIDLSAIDPNAHAKGDQVFTFAGKVAAGATLALDAVSFYQKDGDTTVVIDTTGDGRADFQLTIHGTFTLTADEFVL